MTFVGSLSSTGTLSPNSRSCYRQRSERQLRLRVALFVAARRRACLLCAATLLSRCCAVVAAHPLFRWAHSIVWLSMWAYYNQGIYDLAVRASVAPTEVGWERECLAPASASWATRGSCTVLV